MPPTEAGAMEAALAQEFNEDRQVLFEAMNGQDGDANAPRHGPNIVVDDDVTGLGRQPRAPAGRVKITVTGRRNGGNIGYGTFRRSITGGAVSQLIVDGGPGAASFVHYKKRRREPYDDLVLCLAGIAIGMILYQLTHPN
ncbi:hypothetical protein O1611_g2424 [Lasiodiplodia mahajangana]|uniref:Uncharacterized protein n=1 Tax=Lasiodiplodia mahajangana TaxID=1108764 RepID=A0ACC2JUX0_9PEZI|nr:hypothetical protein O1611_g2424 [Lasiodiplodia mahajangana]